jgi:hypothetical protein
VLQRLLAVALFLTVALCLHADGPKDNLPDNVRPVPPPGIEVPAADRSELQAGVAELGKEIEGLRKSLEKKPDLLRLLPDVQIFHNAVRYALEHNEFYAAREVVAARTLLKVGKERAAQLREGKAPWTTATGQVVRGYRSKIDGSVQPYGLVVPASYTPAAVRGYRLDLWCHGRNEKLTEVNFLDDRQRSPGQFTPAGAFVLHLYGRYCCANKLAGEIDGLEALAHVQQSYPIDENRVVMRGFSMGGAACWQFAVHYPSLWAAAAPGAGFSETAEFLRVFQDESVKPTPYEQKLWRMYDCTGYAVNLYNCPTVAYSGEIDKQKQAADMMAAALEKEGLHLTHLIGPKTGHSYHPATRDELNRRIDHIVERGRTPVPSHIRFATYTLRYNRSFWLTLDGLGQHWEKATADASLELGGVRVRTGNVTALTLSFGPGELPLNLPLSPEVRIDDQKLAGPPAGSDRSWTVHCRKQDGRWAVVDGTPGGTLSKRHGLQGPIDDAFMDSFLMVRPTGKKVWADKPATWVEKELQHAVDHWRKQFRGEARVKNDDAVTDADIAEHNLVLWGDPASNKILGRIAGSLPIRWDAQEIVAGNRRFPSSQHAVILIYPNPLNPKRYVVLNSGFTFREYDYLNNARQVPKLPDWAVVDVSTPPSSRSPGAIAAAGFFDEQWGLKEEGR